MITVHLICNAHIDPIWLWPWQSGLDAALATLRSACDRLDRHPDLYFSRNEAWVYAQIERLDAGLFRRIEKHVQSGRWNIVGGWWIQPDCNQPSGFGMERQIELGRKYFMERFGIFPKTAYNVDTFGHTAALPGLLRKYGQSRYVFMRPQEHEMQLPARVFRWRGYSDGPEVLAFRIAGGYQQSRITKEHILNSTSLLPPGVEHTMCFIGIGDHGGGPSERQISWLRENWNAFENVKFEWSTPDRFFDAIADQASALPLVTGELQHHAIGCYSVHRPVKVALRRAEHLLKQAEIVVAQAPQDAQALLKLEAGWTQACFHQFHDTIGGTCIPSAYRQVDAQLGAALAIADELIQEGLRRPLVDLPDDPHHRVVVLNASDAPYDGYASFEPWLDWKQWKPHWRLLDEQGMPVPYQIMEAEATCRNLVRVNFRVNLKAGERRIFRIDTSQPAITVAAGSETAADIHNSAGVGVEWGKSLRFGSRTLAWPALELIVDKTDTWSHGIDRYSGEVLASATWETPVRADAGALLNTVVAEGRIGQSSLFADWRVYEGENFVELNLRVHWSEKHKLLKLTLPLKNAARRSDGICGGALERANSGKEVPVRDWTLLTLADGTKTGIVMPECYALDATPERLRITLLRGAIMAHHEPHNGIANRYRVSDQGENEFRFRFFHGEVSAEQLEQQALMMQRPLAIADVTRGMQPHVEN